MEAYQTDILTDLESHLVQASGGKRFANYIIDVIAFYVLLFIMGIFIAVINQQAANDVSTVVDNPLLDRLLGLILYGIYMGLVEGLFKGKTLGKLITGTKAVNEDGSTISFGTGFLRGLSRSVPFEAFSALGDPSYPWHDKWNRTYVIDERRSRMSEII